MFLELMLAEGPGEESAVVLPSLKVQNERAFQLCLSENHKILLA
jgi:hypothetical protein